MSEQDRKEFEAWAKTLAWSHFTPQFDTDSNDEYGEQATFRLYLCWLAARRTQDAKVRELVEAVDRMIGHPDTKTFDTSLRVEMDTNLLVDVGNARNALARLKEQPND